MSVRLVPLVDVLTRSNGTVTLDPVQDYRQVTVRMHHNGATLRGIVAGAQIGSGRQFVARTGQLILSRIDARNGAIAIVPPELDGAIVTSDFWLFDIDTTAVSRDYLDNYLSLASFIERCREVSEGTTNRVRLQLERFLALTIPIPELPDQRKAVELLTRMRQRAHEIDLLHTKAYESLDALVVSAHLRSSSEAVRLDDLLELDEKRTKVLPGRSYPQIGVRSFGKGLFARAPLTSDETTYKSFNALFSGAFVLSQVKGWEGAVGVCSEELSNRYASPEYRTFRCRPTKLDPDYLSSLARLPWFWGRLGEATRGVGARRERTRPERFLGLEMPFPSLIAQRDLLPIFQRVEQIRAARVAREETLKAIMGSTTQRILEPARA